MGFWLVSKRKERQQTGMNWQDTVPSRPWESPRPIRNLSQKRRRNRTKRRWLKRLQKQENKRLLAGRATFFLWAIVRITFVTTATRCLAPCAGEDISASCSVSATCRSNSFLTTTALAVVTIFTVVGRSQPRDTKMPLVRFQAATITVEF